MVVILAWILVLFISSLDFITGRAFSLGAFYLAPICWACWVGDEELELRWQLAAPLPGWRAN